MKKQSTSSAAAKRKKNIVLCEYCKEWKRLSIGPAISFASLYNYRRWRLCGKCAKEFRLAGWDVRKIKGYAAGERAAQGKRRKR